MTAITKRYDFVYLFDVTNGNPNGDPDAGNLPRVDPETNRGLVTDVCLKRKIRNFVSLKHNGDAPHAIYMAERSVLNNTNKKAYEALKLPIIDNKLPKEDEKARALTRWMCDQFYDIRTFGAVMTTKVNCGQVRGPAQFTFGQSIDPITPMEISITRGSVTTEKDAETKERTMGRKFIVPYGLYRAHGFISARLANDATKGTGFSENDLELFWQALEMMFESDRSAARGEMVARNLIIFEHESDLGNYAAHKLFDKVTVTRNGDATLPPRLYSDYTVNIDKTDVPGVKLIERI